MGIQGLLPLLKPISKTVHVRELKGCRVAVDAYVWLHRGAYACAAELCQGQDTTRYLNYCIEKARSLLQHGLSLYIVFDGGSLQAKKGTEESRRAKRDQSKREALRCLSNGDQREAFQHWSKAVDVTPAMAHQWIKTIRGVPNLHYVVAPYEADAQLAFLSQNGFVDAIITEDSDSLVFGCPRVLFKLEADGTAQQIKCQDIFETRLEGGLDLRGWTFEMFQILCVIGGNCDYLPSPPGLGLKTAYRYVHRHKTLTKIIRAIRFEAKIKLSPDFEQKCQEALWTFQHQTVFDPASRTIRHLQPLPAELADKSDEELAYLGERIEDEIGQLIADGEIDPFTRQSFSQLLAMQRPTTSTSRLSSGPLPPMSSQPVGIRKFLGSGPKPAPASAVAPPDAAALPAPPPSPQPSLQPAPHSKAGPVRVRHSAGLKKSAVVSLKNSISKYLMKKPTSTEGFATVATAAPPEVDAADSAGTESERREEVESVGSAGVDSGADHPGSQEAGHHKVDAIRETQVVMTSAIACISSFSAHFKQSRTTSEPAMEKENNGRALGGGLFKGLRRTSVGLCRRLSIDHAPPTPATSTDSTDLSCSPAETLSSFYDESLMPPCTPSAPSPPLQPVGSPLPSRSSSPKQSADGPAFLELGFSGGFALDCDDPLVGLQASSREPAQPLLSLIPHRSQGKEPIPKGSSAKRRAGPTSSTSKKAKVRNGSSSSTVLERFSFEQYVYRG